MNSLRYKMFHLLITAVVVVLPVSVPRLSQDLRAAGVSDPGGFPGAAGPQLGA